MDWIENEYPQRYLRHANIVGFGLPPLVGLLVWFTATYAASRNPESFLAHNPWLIYLFSFGPLLAWIYSWRANRVTYSRWPSRIGVGDEGILAEFGQTGQEVKRFSWGDIKGVEVRDQPLGWGHVGYLVLSNGSLYMDMEAWGAAAQDLKRRVEVFKRGLP